MSKLPDFQEWILLDTHELVRRFHQVLLDLERDEHLSRDLGLQEALVHTINFIDTNGILDFQRRSEFLRVNLCYLFAVTLIKSNDFSPLNSVTSAYSRLTILSFVAPFMPQDLLNSYVFSIGITHSDQDIVTSLLPYVEPQFLFGRYYGGRYQIGLLRQLIINIEKVMNVPTSGVFIGTELALAIKSLLPDYAQNAMDLLSKSYCKEPYVESACLSMLVGFINAFTEEEWECLKSKKPRINNIAYDVGMCKVFLGLMFDWPKVADVLDSVKPSFKHPQVASIISKLSRDGFTLLSSKFPNEITLLNSPYIVESVDKFVPLLKRYLHSTSKVHWKLDVPVLEVPLAVVQKLSKREIVTLVDVSTMESTIKKFSLRGVANEVANILAVEVLKDPTRRELYNRFASLYNLGE